MALFVTIGYGDEDGYRRTDPAVREAAHAHDTHLVRMGAQMGIAGPPTQVRNHDAAGTQVHSGPYLRADLPVAGFSIIEADTLDDAIAVVAQTPCAVAQGVVEVWPLQHAVPS